MKGIARVQCLGVLAQVTIGFYDTAGNLVQEEVFPQTAGAILTAKLFHPHEENLTRLIALSIEQAWAKVSAQEGTGGPEVMGPALAADGPAPGTMDGAAGGEAAWRPLGRW